MSAADTQPSGHQPTVRTPTAVPEAAADSHRVRGVRFRSHPDTGRGVRLPGRLRQDGGGPAAAVPARRQRAHVALARLRWSSGPGRRGRRRPAVRTRGHRTRPAGHREPARSGTADIHDLGRGMRTLRQRPRWTAGSRTVHYRSHVRPERDRDVRHRPAPPHDRQIRSLMVAGKPASPWYGSPAQESRPLRYAQVAQGRSLTASLTEQAKLRS